MTACIIGLMIMNGVAPMGLSAAQVEALATDPGSLANGKKSATLKYWSGLGQNEQAVWGVCQGSAAYQVKFEWTASAFGCSCPSRKLPCKHVLGLLFLLVNDPTAAPAGAPPEWVQTWLDKREARAAKKASDAPAAPKDEKASAARRQQRRDRLTDAVAYVEQVINDVIAQGLSRSEPFEPAFWDRHAARLVDFQASGLASHLRRLGSLSAGGVTGALNLLDELGRLTLLCHALNRIDALPAPVATDLLQSAGLNLTETQRADGEVVDDVWICVGQVVDGLERIAVQRSWLVGKTTGRWALFLQFAPGSQPFPSQQLVGVEQSIKLRYYPGAYPQRVEIIDRLTPPTAVTARLPGDAAIAQITQRYTDALARQPWVDRIGVVLHDGLIVKRGDDWRIRDREGRSIPLTCSDVPRLFALSGGEPIDLAGEWNGSRLRIIGVSNGRQFWGGW